jgi:predicted nucleic acid-binding protein
MLTELAKHYEKLKKTSKLSDEGLEQVKNQLFKKVNFWSEETIPAIYWTEANRMVSDIDPNDIAVESIT